MKINDNLDLNRSQLLNTVIQNLPAAPLNPVPGLVYYNTILNSTYEWNGTKWIARDAAKLAPGTLPLSVLVTNPLARANHTGTQLTSTISDLGLVVHGYPVNTFAVATGNTNMGGFTLSNLNTAPNGVGQAAEWSWVNNKIQSALAGIDTKPSVRALSLANVPVISGLLIVDTVQLVAGNRVLLARQTNLIENGPYIVNAGTWVRASDVITPQAFWPIEEGSLGNKGSQWKVATTGVITTGTTPIVIDQFAPPITYANGLGLTLTGNVFSLLTPVNSGLVVNASGVQVDNAIIPRKVNVTIGDGVTTVFTITHNLGTLGVIASAMLKATGEIELVKQVNATINTTVISFVVAPALNAYQISLMG